MIAQKVYSGFRLLEERNIKEVNSIGRLFIHEKTGAQLLQLENDDDNKVFSVSFRTPPKNSTGLPHILEHSVLCGSEKFPVKEPFVELIKGSLNTFLNAMTFSDKTMYPVASRNEKDFFNLMDVYLDAVLHPNIYKYPEILMQEGWHYELDSKDGELTYKGVVYNEMKGAFSSPESVLFRKIQESLFPETTYGVESGGDPDVIPELTQEEFLDFHRKYYHPSNSYIFLYGNGDILKQLEFINDRYLKEYEKIEVDSKIPLQRSFEEQRNLTFEYPISPNDDERDKTFLSLNFAVSKSTDPETYLAFDILEHLLLETQAAPLKNALIKAKIGKDVFGAFDTSILQPALSVVVKNSNEDKKEEFERVVFDTLRDLVKNGIDKKLIEASINIKEFRLRESDSQGYPKGLLYGIKVMDSWLHGESPFMHLEYEATLNKIKRALSENYFEKLIEEHILSNKHRSLLIVKPLRGMSEEKAKKLKDMLERYKNTLSDEEKEKIIEQTLRLRERQTTPDNPGDLEKIPLLSLEDINKEAEKLPLEERNEEVKILLHPMFTNKVAYLNLYFDSSCIPQEDIQYIPLLAGVLAKVSTDKYSYEELSKEININTGGIRHSADAYGESGNDEIYYPRFVVKSKVLVDKLPSLMELIGEILSSSRFNDRGRLKDVIQELKSRLEMNIFDSGHIVSMNRVLSYFSPLGKYNELTKGIEYYKFLSKLDKTFESSASGIENKLEGISRKLFNRDNLLISVTMDNEDYSEFTAALPELVNRLGNEKVDKLNYSFEFKPYNEGLLTSGNVQYVAKAYNFKRLGYSYSGNLQVLRTIAGLDYLWNRVRVQGGAYGSFAGFERNGNIYFASYRDPNLKETLGVYDETPDYVRGFEADEREMTKYIIGTISRLDSPLSPQMKGEKAAVQYITHVKHEDIQRERDEVLSTNPEALRSFESLIKDSMKQNYLCVLGNEEKINQNKDVFNNLVKVFE